jgi:hypothetical protein
MSDFTTKADTITIPSGVYENNPIYAHVRDGQRVIIEEGVECVIDKDVRTIDNGHPLQLNGLRGSTPQVCRVAVFTRILKGKRRVLVPGLTRMTFRLLPGAIIMDDVVNIISVQGVKGRPIVIAGNTIVGRNVVPGKGGGAETAIIVDRGCAWVVVKHNRIGTAETPFVTGNAAINVTSSSHVVVTLNTIVGLTLNPEISAINAFDFYHDGMTDVRTGGNDTTGWRGPAAWNDVKPKAAKKG